MEKFFINVVAGVFADPRVQAALDKLIAERVMPLVPLAVATAGKFFTDYVDQKFSKVLESDPDIPGISDVFDLSELIRTTMNGHPEVNIPVIGDWLKELNRG